MASQINAESAAHQPPPLKRAASGDVEHSSLADVIEWFLRYDARVGVINHPRVEEIFQWKQKENSAQDESQFQFARAEDRLAIGIFRAIAENGSEPQLHKWITELLGALDEASKMNEEIATSYNLRTEEDASPIEEAAKLPSRSAQTVYLNTCWLETLCTAEARVLGWIYQEIYDRPFHPNNFEKQG